ncbi:hypothetical protein CMT52_14670 [Elizabethkingia anophelis]|jgi:hypothetical protein|nr:hypothetical protein [Elizabethkingia anophelis]
MENKLNINLSSDNNYSTLLIGEALTPKEPERLSVSGDFTAVGNYLKIKKQTANRLQEIRPENAIVICDYDNLTIQLQTNPNDTFSTIITGKAEYSKEYKDFGINQSKFFNREQLIKLFRFNRRYFPNKEENANLLGAYQNFTASVNKNIADNSDLRGNKISHLQKTVRTDLPESFVVEIPVFKGEAPVSFPVEICIEDNDSGVRFWFESVELDELIQEKKEYMFSRELSECQDLAIIYK